MKTTKAKRDELRAMVAADGEYLPRVALLPATLICLLADADRCATLEATLLQIKNATVNNCTCGGAGPGMGCAWCDVYHLIGGEV